MEPASAHYETPIDVPDHWRNLLADYPQYNGNKLSDAVASSALAEQRRTHLPKIPLAIGRQANDTKNRYIPVPGEVLEMYRQYRRRHPLRQRPSVREGSRDLVARIYYKYEGGNISGSHKLNTALAQAYYYREGGGAACRHRYRGRPVGQRSSPSPVHASASKCTVFMPPRLVAAETDAADHDGALRRPASRKSRAS